MEALVPRSGGQARALPETLADDEPYVILPEPLALDLRDSPLAVGIYLLVGRAFLVQQGPIPLSATDIEAYDGSGTLRRGAILRALDRLCTGGYLLPQSKQGRGLKATYLPSWGLVGGVPRPWSFEAAGLDRPRSVRAVRVPRTVLDVCLGRLTPHLRHAALIDRYVTHPPISLRDLGAYGLAWAGIVTSRPALTRLGLVDSSGPLPPPTWEQLLARISQLLLFDADPKAPGLSPRGLQRAGLTTAPASPTPETTPLFFVPHDMIGCVIPRMIDRSISQGIAHTGANKTVSSAPERANVGAVRVPEVTTGTLGTLANLGNEATPASPTTGGSSSNTSLSPIETPPADRPAQGAAICSPQEHMPAASPTLASDGVTPTEQALRDLGVYPSVARQYRDLQSPLVERAQMIAQRLPGRKSLAATVAQLLREEVASPGWLSKPRPDLFIGPMYKAPSIESPEASPDGCDDTLHGRVYARLCEALGRLALFIERAHIIVDEKGQVAVQIPSWFSPAERAEVRGAVDAVTAQLGLCIGSTIDDVPPASPEPPPPAPPSTPATAPVDKSKRPDWISPEQWSQLHLMVRGALSGSRWEDEEIVGDGPGTTRLLRGHLAGLVSRLRAGQMGAEPPESTRLSASDHRRTPCLVDGVTIRSS